MENQELITVKEYAAAARISRQAVYKQLSTKLSDFKVEVDGKVFLKKEALGGFSDNQVDNQVDKTDNQVDKTDNQTDNQKEQESVSILLEMMKQEIEKKDLEIKDLREKLDKAYDKIGDLAEQAHYIAAAEKTAQIIDKQEISETQPTEMPPVDKSEKGLLKIFNIFKKKV